MPKASAGGGAHGGSPPALAGDLRTLLSGISTQIAAQGESLRADLRADLQAQRESLRQDLHAQRESLRAHGTGIDALTATTAEYKPSSYGTRLLHLGSAVALGVLLVHCVL